MGSVGGRVARSAKRPLSNTVLTLRTLLCPTVGARKPVLTAPRSAKVGDTSRRAATLPSKVEPKSS